MTSELYLHIFTFSGRNRQRGHFDHRNKFNVYKYSAVDCVRPFAKEEIKTPNKVLLEMYENLLIVEGVIVRTIGVLPFPVGEAYAAEASRKWGDTDQKGHFTISV